LIVGGGLALTACEAVKNGKQSSRLDDFEETGEVRNCVSIIRIDQADAIDDRTILFEMRGSEYYVNRLPHSCPQLGFEERFTYATSLHELCNTDIITVITSTGPGASCGLGLFERLKKKDEAQSE